MRHPPRRIEQSVRSRDFQVSPPSNNAASARAGFAHDDFSEEDRDYAERSHVNRLLPYVDAIKLNWRWSSNSEIADPVYGEGSHRPVVNKECSVFVGCIPDGIEEIGVILQNLMESFLERFDFAPFHLGQVQVVRLVKDFAFLELVTDKVAQIVLAANQLDVFEWGFNGCHFNIEGCNGTFTSVKPLYEYIPLKPARVIFVGNVPQNCWQTEYLEEVFTKILWGSDGQTDLRPVVAVYLLPESSDAYVELSSEFIADALIYKCIKNDQLLKEIGEEVFICRDVNSPPLMSRHKVDICPQRSLFIGISVHDEYFKIDCVRKVFAEILPLISRKTNRDAYLEYISLQPGKDYAFFQFNSEIIADAIMDEYVENTQLFVCKNVNVTYIILRLPEYVRPGARYHQAMNQRRLSGKSDSRFERSQKGPFHASADRRQFSGGSRLKNTEGDFPGTVMQMPRKYGDEPSKKADCVMAMGASLPPIAIWNGPGASSADPESLIVVEGIPKGFNYKLLRGALNELFERTLAQSGLLEVGMLILGYLDRDEDFVLVGCLPSAEFVHALLSVRKVFIVCGHEIRLLAKDGRNNLNGRRKVAAASWDDDEFGSDDEEGMIGNGDANEWNGPELVRERKRGYAESGNACGITVRGMAMKRKFSNASTDEWYESQGFSPPSKDEFHSQESNRDWSNYNSVRAMEGAQWQDGNARGNTAFGNTGVSLGKNRGFVRNQNAGRNFRRGFRRLN